MNGTEKSILVLIANRDQSIAAAKAYNLRPYFRTLRTDLSWMSFRNCIGLAVHSLAWFKNKHYFTGKNSYCQLRSSSDQISKNDVVTAQFSVKLYEK